MRNELDESASALEVEILSYLNTDASELLAREELVSQLKYDLQIAQETLRLQQSELDNRATRIDELYKRIERTDDYMWWARARGVLA